MRQGIDKLTYRHGLALQVRGLNAQYIDASAHCEVIFKSKHARKSHIPVTELVNLSIPSGEQVETQLRLIDLVYIEGGTFEMGDVLEEEVMLASPVHTVTVSSFELAEYEVTVGQFAAFAAATDYVTLAEDPTERSRQAMQHPAVPGDEEYLERLTTPGAFVLTTPSEGDWVARPTGRTLSMVRAPATPWPVCRGGMP